MAGKFNHFSVKIPLIVIYVLNQEQLEGISHAWSEGTHCIGIALSSDIFDHVVDKW